MTCNVTLNLVEVDFVFWIHRLYRLVSLDSDRQHYSSHRLLSVTFEENDDDEVSGEKREKPLESVRFLQK